MNKGLFFMTLSLICFWLVLDQFYGDQRIKNLVSSLFDGETIEYTSEANQNGNNRHYATDDNGEKTGFSWEEIPGNIGGTRWRIYWNDKLVGIVKGWENVEKKKAEYEGGEK